PAAAVESDVEDARAREIAPARAAARPAPVVLRAVREAPVELLDDVGLEVRPASVDTIQSEPARREEELIERLRDSLACHPRHSQKTIDACGTIVCEIVNGPGSTKPP